MKAKTLLDQFDSYLVERSEFKFWQEDGGVILDYYLDGNLKLSVLGATIKEAISEFVVKMDIEAEKIWSGAE